MKITRVTPRAIAEPGGQQCMVVRLDTDEGLSGYAETDAPAAAQAAVDRLKQELHRLAGMDPSRTPRIDEDLRSPS